MNLFHRWSDSLAALKSRGRYRSLQVVSGVDLTSNDYLGYASLTNGHPQLWEPNSHREKLPVSGAGSRLLGGQHPIWDEVESELAKWHGSETALIMPSGYAANEGILPAIIEPDDWVASDEFNHASIIDGLRLTRARRHIFRHNDLNQLEAALCAEAKLARPGTERFIVTESLFSMDGDRSPLKEIVDLAERYGAHVIVDDAHATGCWGPRGAGLVDEAGLRSRVLATVHTGGKALGVVGAYICGSQLLKQILVNRCRPLIFSTALPPAIGGWWQVRIPQVQADESGRQALRANADLFRNELARFGISARGSDQIVPILIGEDERAERVALALQERGYGIRAVRPPSVPAGQARLRISIHADHAPEMLTQLAADLENVLAS